jgi:DNA-directed RNA polymerase specialized sigma24 family protein
MIDTAEWGTWTPANRTSTTACAVLPGWLRASPERPVPEVDEIADEAMARLLLQDGLVNNPKAWVRRTATQLAVAAYARQRLRPDDVLQELDPIERRLVVGQRVGFTTRELAQRLGVSEDETRALLAEANRKARRSSRRVAEAER